ncbi:MAG TPA: DUF4388 domain-containing protein [Candidatus Polarisedimenticolia bacterium]|nr:DUF4388 domain-containing protein [Candidatus Polarisedimenticolia bacterium]
MTNKPVLTGDLSSIPLADVISMMNLAKKTGVLRCTQGADSRSVFWEQGDIVFARSNAVRDNLGCFLVRRGLITEEQNAESSRRITRDTRHGKVLVRLGYITTEQLWWAVKNQVLEIVYGLFQWSSGYFEFIEGQVENREKIMLAVPTTKIVMEGIRRLDEWNRYATRIRDATQLLEPVPGRLPGVGREQDASPEERKVLALVNGTRTVGEISRLSGQGEFETYAALYDALQAGEIRERGV